MNNKPIIGIDLGGTKIMTGIVRPNGEIMGDSYAIDTGGNDSQDKILDRIFLSISEVLNSSGIQRDKVQGIGIGSTGPVDMKNGKILECPQLPTLHHFPLKDVIESKLNIPVVLDNDANCLILGESYFGAGRGHKIILGFTLGTGLGCGIVLNKKIFLGATQCAGEIWSSPYLNNSIEDYVSGSGVSKTYQQLSGSLISAKEINVLANNGDKNAIKTWKQFGEWLSIAVSWGINFVDPDIVILGGSISNAWDWFYPELEHNIKKFICPLPALKTEIVPAKLGKHAGFIGAACLVLQNNNLDGPSITYS